MLKHNIKKLFMISLSVILLLGTCLFPSMAIADDDVKDGSYPPKDEDASLSIQKDLFMGILQKKINDGRSIFPVDGSWESTRRDINYHIAKGDATTKYSLFDRFGSNISFSQYTGEVAVHTSIIDSLYTTIAKGNVWDFKVGSIIEILTRKPSEFNNAFYDDRPLLKTAEMDPRVKRYCWIPAADGASVAGANYLLDTAKILTTCATYFVTPDLVNSIATLVQKLLEGTLGKILKSFLSVILAVAGVALIIFIIRTAFKALKGDVALRKFIVNFIIGLINVGLIVILIAQPGLFLNIMKNAFTLGDIITADAVNKFLQTQDSPEISASGINDNVVKASLWKESIFRPWVRAEFGGTDYEDLYTTYSDHGNKWEVQDEAAKAYGDIKVSIGNNTDIKNWAALAYSTHTIYHLNATEETKVTDDAHEVENWPRAERPQEHISIYTDDFRWIDASLKVGQYGDAGNGKKADKITDPYINTREYWFLGWMQGGRAIWMSILLIPIGILGFKKLKAGIFCIINGVRLVIENFKSLIWPETNDSNITNMLRIFALPLADYLFYSVTVAVGVMLYLTIGKSDNFLIQLLFIGLAIFLAVLTPQKLFTGIKDFQAGWNHEKNHMKDWWYNRRQSWHDDRLIDRIEKKKGRLPYNLKDYNANWANTDEDGKSTDEQRKENKKTVTGVDQDVIANAGVTILDYNQGTVVPNFKDNPLNQRLKKLIVGNELRRCDLYNVLTPAERKEFNELKKKDKNIQSLWKILKRYYVSLKPHKATPADISKHRNMHNNKIFDYYLFNIETKAEVDERAGVINGARIGRFTGSQRLQAKEKNKRLSVKEIDQEIAALEERKKLIDKSPKMDPQKKANAKKDADHKIERLKKKRKRLNKDIKRIEKDKKWEGVQDGFQFVTGTKLPLGHIPLRLKVKILLYLLAAYGIGLLAAMAIGI